MPELILPVSSVDTPDQWTLVGASNKVHAVETILPTFEESYIISDDPTKEQWFNVSIPGTVPSMTENIIAVKIQVWIRKHEDPEEEIIDLAAGPCVPPATFFGPPRSLVQTMMDVGSTTTTGGTVHQTHPIWYFHEDIYTASPDTGLPWEWTGAGSVSDISRIGIKGFTDPINYPGQTGTAECTFLQIVVLYGKTFNDCPTCCCCCMCFHPTVLLSHGFMSFVLPGVPSDPPCNPVDNNSAAGCTVFKSPRTCIRMDYIPPTPGQGDNVCLFSPDAWIQEWVDEHPLPGGRFLGIGSGDYFGEEMYWYLVGGNIVATPIDPSGCLSVQLSFEVRDAAGNPIFTELVSLTAPSLVQCDPYHISCGDMAEDSTLSINGATLNVCDNFEEPNNVTSIFLTGCNGRLIVTCDPQFNYELCLGQDYLAYGNYYIDGC